jgi:hypothetical protein
MRSTVVLLCIAAASVSSTFAEEMHTARERTLIAVEELSAAAAAWRAELEQGGELSDADAEKLNTALRAVGEYLQAILSHGKEPAVREGPVTT